MISEKFFEDLVLGKKVLKQSTSIAVDEWSSNTRTQEYQTVVCGDSERWLLILNYDLEKQAGVMNCIDMYAHEVHSHLVYEEQDVVSILNQYNILS